MIKVSVIVPVYNGEKYLEQCLDSICNQTLQEIEIICVDDGSTDSSWDILNRYKDQDDRIQLYRQQNLYAGVARNTGKSHATGEYLVFWDCDDFFEPDALEKMYDQCQQDQADICVCGVKRYLQDIGIGYTGKNYVNKKRIPEEIPFNIKTNEKYILTFSTVAAWNKMYRHDFVDKWNMDFQALKHANDAFFSACTLCLAEKITIVTKPLVWYRISQSDSLMGKAQESPLDPIYAWISVKEYLEGKGLFPKQSFDNRVLDVIFYTLSHMKTWQAFETLVSYLKTEGLEKLGITTVEDDSYYSIEYHQKWLEHLLQDSTEDFISFMLYQTYLFKVKNVTQKEHLSETLKRTQKELQKAENRKTTLTARNEALKEKQKILKEKNADLKRQLREQKKKNEALGKKLRTVEQENQKIRASWSFRIGKVLVWLPGKIKRLFRKQ